MKSYSKCGLQLHSIKNKNGKNKQNIEIQHFPRLCWHYGMHRQDFIVRNLVESIAYGNSPYLLRV